MLKPFIHITALLLGLAATGPAAAQAFPGHPITMVVAFPAGGPTDVMARLIAERMATRLGQQIVIENLGGAGGTIGAARVARAAPDGYTLMLHQVALAAGAALYGNLTYDTAADFDGIGLVNYQPMVILGRKNLSAGNLTELVGWMRDNRAQVTFAHSGIGTPAHLCEVLFVAGIGAQVIEVPYRGGGPALNDLLADQVDLFCGQTAGAVEQIRSHAVRGYAVTSPARVEALPELPSLEEAGFKGLETVVWHALFAPRGTPAPVIAQLNTALRAALADHDLIERFEATGLQLYRDDQLTPAVAKQLLVDEVAKWAKVIRENNITTD
jgi:tripartite-type tricarboxylate transporter receptor subunit TctC